MNESEYGKKLIEEHELAIFIRAYELVTGELLEHLCSRESPDFVCKRRNGKEIGVELVSIMREPDMAFFEEVIERKYYMSEYDFLNKIYYFSKNKSDKMKNNKWPFRKQTILVIQSHDFLLEELDLDISIQKDYASLGFKEIWIGNYTEVDQHGNIELFGLHPKKWWGHHYPYYI